MPGVRQHDATDCAAACLASVALHYGRRVPIARIRQLADTDRTGTNVLGLVEAASRLGFTAKGVRGTSESLEAIPLPAIAHVTRADGTHHFVVLYRVRRDALMVMDPRDGRTTRMGRKHFVETWSGVLILLLPSEPLEAGNASGRTLPRFWRLVRPHRSVLVQALIGAAVYTLLGLTTAVYIQKIVDYVLVDGNRGLLNLLSAAMVAALAAQIHIGTAKARLVLDTGQRIDAALLLGYHRHLLRLPQRFFDTMRVGEIIARAGDAVKIRALINDVALDLVVNALIVMFSFVLMAAYSWRLTFVVGLVIPVYALVLWVANRMNRRHLRSLMEHGAELESTLVQSVTAISTIRRFGLADDFDRRVESKVVRVLRAARGAALASILSARGSEAASRAAVIGLFWFGSGLVIDGALTPGGLMSFYALVGYLTGPLTHLVGANRQIQDALIAADRLFEILDLERDEERPGVELWRSGPEPTRKTSTDVSVTRAPEIVLEGVRFRYGSRPRVFDGLDLRIKAGSFTAIVGESGSGKSTLINVLQKLYPLEDGVVRIGTTELREIDTAGLRRWIAAVPQETHLFTRTVLENIALDDPTPDLERIFELCDSLEITPFVRALPAGFQTLIAENGAGLSGGQRQRLSVARALYRKPAVLLLDEATSHLDSRGERAVQRRLAAARNRGMTLIVVAHRLSTIAGADHIAIIDRGRVVEEGGHGDLLARNGRYADLWRLQMENAEPAVGGTHGAEGPASPG
jgi:ATP-binding cassette subfamily B protein